MKLHEIKHRLVSAFFSARGQGAHESELDGIVDKLCEHLQLSADCLTEDLQESDEHLLAYKELAKGQVAIGCIQEGADLLYAVVRSGKQLACINLTAPTKIERNCSLKDVKDAFTEAAAINSGIVFKTSYRK